MKDDIINKPNHYHKNNIDVIKFSELQFNRKNKVEDLEKAKFYINKLIELNN